MISHHCIQRTEVQIPDAWLWSPIIPDHHDLQPFDEPTTNVYYRRMINSEK